MELDSGWWRRDGGGYSMKWIEFNLALKGFDQANGRLTDDDSWHTVIECVWWISAAAEAAELKGSEDVIGALWWIRNKAFHDISVAPRQIQPSRAPAVFDKAVFDESVFGDSTGVPFSIWLPFENPQADQHRWYNEHLAGRSIYETLDEAAGILNEISVAIEMATEIEYTLSHLEEDISAGKVVMPDSDEIDRMMRDDLGRGPDEGG